MNRGCVDLVLKRGEGHKSPKMSRRHLYTASKVVPGLKARRRRLFSPLQVGGREGNFLMSDDDGGEDGAGRTTKGLCSVRPSPLISLAAAVTEGKFDLGGHCGCGCSEGSPGQLGRSRRYLGCGRSNLKITLET